MNSQLVFGRGSTQVLGNMPFQSELATGSALNETDRRLDEIAQCMGGLNRQITYIDSTRPTRTEIHGISGNYATHTEVQDWAKYASGNAATYADTAIAEASGSLAYEIDQLEEGYKSADTYVLSGAEKYARDLVRDTSAALKTDYGNRFTTEANTRASAVAAEHDRASGAEYRIENKFDDWCATISGNLDMSAKLLSGEDIRINGRIDTYRQTFSAVLDDVSATAKEALEENDFHDFIDSAGVQYEKAVKTMYLGKGVRGNISLSANGDIASRNIATNGIDAVSATYSDSVYANGGLNASELLIRGDKCQFRYDGGNEIVFEDYDTINGNKIEFALSGKYNLAPAISYANETVYVGNKMANTVLPVSAILIGDAHIPSNHIENYHNTVVIAPPIKPNAGNIRWWPKHPGSVAIYTSADPVENGIYIGDTLLSGVIIKYAASKQDLESEVLEEIQNASGTIKSGIQQDVQQAVNQTIESARQTLSAYVGTEIKNRQDDVQSVRDELPRYLPVMGGTILGDLTASAFNVFDAFSAIDEGPNKLFPYNDNYFISGVEIRATLLTPMAVLEKRIASGIPADSTDVRLDITGVVYHEDPETHVRTVSGDYHRSDTLECQYASSVSQYIYDGELGRVHVPLNSTKSITIWEYLLSAGSYTFLINDDCNFCGPVSIVQYVDERTEAIATAASTLQEVAEYLKSINEGD